MQRQARLEKPTSRQRSGICHRAPPHWRGIAQPSLIRLLIPSAPQSLAATAIMFQGTATERAGSCTNARRGHLRSKGDLWPNEPCSLLADQLRTTRNRARLAGQHGCIFLEDSLVARPASSTV